MARGRREFMKAMAGTAGVMASLSETMRAFGGSGRSIRYEQAQGGGASSNPASPRLKFAVVGINHDHIYSQVRATLRGGGELVWLYAKEPDLIAQFTKAFPQAKLARSEAEVLEDKSIQLVLSSIVPVERAPLGIRVMQHGKDYMSDKPGITTLEQLAEVRRVQAQTKRIYSIMYGERFENHATVKAGELARAGAIGHVVQTIGMGPHLMRPKTRPEWFFDKQYYGGILVDIGSHQADQFLYFTNSTKGDILASQAGNVHNQQYPNFEDFGDMLVRGDGGAGYIRTDWFTPDGLPTWGDGRITILGTDGYMEVRKNVDIAEKGLGSHLFLVDQKETRYIDCKDLDLPFGPHLVDDVLNRTETAMPQEHCFMAMELVLKAQKQAQRVNYKM